MDEGEFSGRFGDRIGELCEWAANAAGSTDFEVDSAPYDRLHTAVNAELTYKSDGLPLVLTYVCGFDDPRAVLEKDRQHWEASGAEETFPDPEWFMDPPYLWEASAADS